jgi:hypothetical protein
MKMTYLHYMKWRERAGEERVPCVEEQRAMQGGSNEVVGDCLQAAVTEVHCRARALNPPKVNL